MSIISAPVKLLGIAAAGVAFAAGWKLGCYLGDVVTGEKRLPWPDLGDFIPKEKPDPLWKRKFSRVTAD